MNLDIDAGGRDYWAGKVDGGHRASSEPWLARYAEEILLLIEPGGVLVDVGCGACELTSYFAARFERIYAVDFSDSMLAAAAERLARLKIDNVRLLKGALDALPAEIARADAVMSFAVVQYNSADVLDRHLKECRRVLAEDGAVCIANVPDKRRRDWYYQNVLLPPAAGRLGAVRRLTSMGQRFAKRLGGDPIWDEIGHWYSPDEIAVAAAREGFAADIRNTWYYEYRFHALLRPNRQP